MITVNTKELDLLSKIIQPVNFKDNEVSFKTNHTLLMNVIHVADQ